MARSEPTAAGLLLVGEDSQRKNNTHFMLDFALLVAAWTVK